SQLAPLSWAAVFPVRLLQGSRFTEAPTADEPAPVRAACLCCRPACLPRSNAFHRSGLVPAGGGRRLLLARQCRCFDLDGAQERLGAITFTAGGIRNPPSLLGPRFSARTCKVLEPLGERQAAPRLLSGTGLNSELQVRT